MTIPATDVNPWEELNRLRKAARLALAFSNCMRDSLGLKSAVAVAEYAKEAVPADWYGLAKQGFLTRPSEATIAMAVELLASATRHPSAHTS